jgi:hypothetical protein
LWHILCITFVITLTYINFSVISTLCYLWNFLCAILINVQFSHNRDSTNLFYVQQDATLHSLFYLETALHVSGGITTHHQERKQLYLQHLVFVTLLLLPATYHPKHVEQFPDKINCVTSHLVGYILEYSYDARTC